MHYELHEPVMPNGLRNCAIIELAFVFLESASLLLITSFPCDITQEKKAFIKDLALTTSLIIKEPHTVQCWNANPEWLVQIWAAVATQKSQHTSDQDPDCQRASGVER